MTTLFVNACLRGDRSKTMELCREYLSGKDDLQEVNLAELRLQPIDAEFVEKRTKLQRAGEFDDPIFDLSRQFAAADEVVIGAPYWDLSFPSALKVYIEHVSVCDLVFKYTEDAQCVGICKAKRLIYLSTAGGSVEGANYGYDYFRGIAKMYGISETHCVVAEGTDIWGADVAAILEEAKERVRALKQ